jgi:hypothetical protein
MTVTSDSISTLGWPYSSTAIRLAATGCPSRAVVQGRFYITPLVPALTTDERFYILALS